MSNRNNSSVVSTGWTTLSSPKRRAVACRPKKTSMSANPISQTPRRMAWVMRLRRSVVESGRGLHPDPLQYRGQGIDKGAGGGEKVGHPSVVAAIGTLCPSERARRWTDVPVPGRMAAVAGRDEGRPVTGVEWALGGLGQVPSSSA